MVPSSLYLTISPPVVICPLFPFVPINVSNIVACRITSCSSSSFFVGLLNPPPDPSLVVGSHCTASDHISSNMSISLIGKRRRAPPSKNTNSSTFLTIVAVHVRYPMRHSFKQYLATNAVVHTNILMLHSRSFLSLGYLLCSFT